MTTDSAARAASYRPPWKSKDRGVQQVDLFIFPFKRCHGRGDRRLAADLLRVGITDRVALAYFTATIGCACKIKHSFREGGLAGAGMAIAIATLMMFLAGYVFMENTPYMYNLQFQFEIASYYILLPVLQWQNCNLYRYSILRI